MKEIKIILATILALCALDSANAQMRYADLKIEFVTPKTNAVIQSPQIIQFSFQVLNQGPDTIYTTDSFYYTPGHTFGGGGIKRRMAFPKILTPNDSIIIYDTISVNSQIDRYPFDLALLPHPYAFGLDYGHGKLQNEFWEDRADNTPRVVLIHKGSKLSAGNLLTNDKLVDIYPNPCSQNVISIYSQSGKYDLDIFDMTGQKQNYHWVESDMNNGKKEVSLEKSASGIYFFYIKTDEEIFVKKVVYE